MKEKLEKIMEAEEAVISAIDDDNIKSEIRKIRKHNEVKNQ